MAESDIRALAFVVHSIRPSWPLQAIESALGDDHRDLGSLSRAAVVAAQNPATRHPNGIRTTFPGADGCTKCAERERAQTAQPPPVERCRTCGRIIDTEHTCRPSKPAWFAQSQQLAARYSRDISAAKATGNHQLAADLKSDWQTQLDQLTEATA